MKQVLYHVARAVLGALAMVGLFTVTGFPLPVSRQVFIAVCTGAGVEAYLAWYDRKRRRKEGQQGAIAAGQ